MSLKDHALIERGRNNGFIIVSIVYLYLTFMDHENVIPIFFSLTIVSYYSIADCAKQSDKCVLQSVSQAFSR